MLRFDSLYDEAARLGVRVEERRLSGSVCGYYYDACRLILLDERLADHQRLCTLCHELVHAEYRDISCVCDSRFETRTRRITASRLISDVDYKFAEAMYGTDVWLLSEALGVTCDVIQDYRSFLSTPVLV